MYCTECGNEVSRKTVTVPALGHEDADNDGNCDRCGEKMEGGDHCKWCGKIHDRSTFRGRVTAWFHTFLYYVKPYIIPILGVVTVIILAYIFL